MTLALADELKALVPALGPALSRAIGALPPSLALKKIAYYRVSSDIVLQKRAAFRKLKSDFLRFLGQHNGEDLRMMGLNDYAVERMRDHGRMPANNPGEQMDCTVDHILSLNFGGLNTIDNLMLIPGRVNMLKNDIERAQFSAAPYAHVITIVPAIPDARVPYIPGGFQKAQQPDKTLSA